MDVPQVCEVLSVQAAAREARRWGGHDRWVLQETLDYVDLLLQYVRERVAQDGGLTREVSTVLADPALDLLGELRDVAVGEQHAGYAEMIDYALADVPLLSQVPRVVPELDDVPIAQCYRATVVDAILRALSESAHLNAAARHRG